MTIVNPAYFEREQTAVKHRVLEQYLLPLPLIVGRTIAKDVTFVDCCSGPWETMTEDQSDASFGIAVRQLRQARQILKDEGHRVSFRGLFIEIDPAAYAKLEKFCQTVTDMEVKSRRGDFVELIPQILRFLNEQPKSFPFFFIDPKGWAPLKIAGLTPLLQRTPGEVLINFMTSFICRFLQEEGKDFDELISPEALLKMRGLTGQDRYDAAAFAYADEIARSGDFDYVCTTLIAKPQMDQTYYHLIYGTRHPKGVEVFKQAERNAAEFMSLVRAEAHERQQQKSTGQHEMFLVEQCGAGQDHYLLGLRSRYLQQARELVEQMLVSRGQPVPYEDAWKIACRFPFVYESNLREWITHDWREKVSILGLKPKQRVPKCQAHNCLVWTGARSAQRDVGGNGNARNAVGTA